MFCHTSCLTCKSSASTGCITCPVGKYFLSGKCVGSCPDKSFPSDLTLQCYECDPRCSKCLDATHYNCQACTSGYYLFGGTICQPSCPPSYFENSTTLTCDSCDPGCTLCDLATDACQVCNAGFFFQPPNKCLALCPGVSLNADCLDKCPIGF
jgi:proprotein convertase subtilisin/kexin type 5